MLIALCVLVAMLAFTNGSNDSSKGVATLVGYGAATPRRALAYATLTTALGAAVSFWFSSGLIKSFSRALFTEQTPIGPAFFVAVLIGAIGWVMFATWTGLPVSTTHAITGALIGAGLVAFGASHLQWHVLGRSFVLPLALSPVLSLAAVYLVAWPVSWGAKRYAARCVCVVPQTSLVESGAALTANSAGLSVVADTEQACEEAGMTSAVTTSGVSNAIHWLSGGWIGFARGWNDAPKITGLCAIAMPTHLGFGFLIVTLAMALGGLVAGRRVLETLARKVTPLPLAESLTASATTAVLVSLASWGQQPVSTTHVSTGAIVGAGLKNDPSAMKWKKVAEIVLSWVVTLPVAGLIAAGAQLLIH